MSHEPKLTRASNGEWLFNKGKAPRRNADQVQINRFQNLMGASGSRPAEEEAQISHHLPSGECAAGMRA